MRLPHSRPSLAYLSLFSVRFTISLLVAGRSPPLNIVTGAGVAGNASTLAGAVPAGTGAEEAGADAGAVDWADGVLESSAINYFLDSRFS